MKPSRVGIYIRVSTPGQATEEKASLTEQEADCRAYCKQQGYQLDDSHHVYKDVARGSTKRRPEFQRLLADMKSGALDVVVAWKTDRFSRSIFVAAALMEALEESGCKIECARERVDLRSLTLYAAVGQMELDNIRERTTMGKRAAAKAGRIPHGRGVYGYRAGKNGKPAIDPDEGPVVQRIFTEYAAGRSTDKIAAGLDLDGVLPRGGGRWNPAYIAMRLRDPTYIGRGYYSKIRYTRTETGVKTKPYPKDDWIEVPHPPLVDKALWARVAQRREKRFTGDPSGEVRRDFLLRRLLTCSECGKGFVCRSSRRDAGRWYECYTTFARKGACRQKPQIINAALLEGEVWQVVVDLIADPDLLEEAVRAQVETLRERGAYADLEDVRRSLDKLTAEEDRVITLRSREKISEAQMERQLRRFTERREHYVNRIAVLESEVREADRAIGRVKDFRQVAAGIAGRLDDLTFEERRRVMLAVVESITIDGANNVRLDVAVYPERLQDGADVDAATIHSGRLWPEIAIR